MRRLPVLALLLLLAACRTLPFPDPELKGEYGLALKKWTRQVALYSGLETRAFVRVVYLAPEFVDAQAKQLSLMKAELPDKTAETLAQLRQQYRQPSFFAVVYIPDRTANDWNEKDSVWRLALNLGLGERAPEKVERFEVPFNAELRALYPYLDEYSVAYLLRFPEPVAPVASAPGGPGAPAPFTPVDAQLIIAGAPGKMVFHWRLDGGRELPSKGESGADLTPVSPPKQ